LATRTIRYAVDGWGVGELLLEGDRLVWHELPRAGRAPAAGSTHPFATRLEAYFAGEPVRFDDVELDLEGYSPLSRRFAAVLRAVPRGEVVSYGELAALAGRPRAARAAGTFCAGNRHPIVVPCHRVVGANGIGPFGELGVEYKRRLLALEGAGGFGGRTA
jgi:methylated-DNA-[protein]-cysteine S-methyltransferase